MRDPVDHSRYAEWDGAYVLGALAPAERREYEAHLETCGRCRAAVTELSGLPGLLGRLDGARAFALLSDEAGAEADRDIPTPPADLVARIERAERRRRSRRVRLVVGLAAAAAVVAAIVIPVSITSAPHPDLTVALAPAETSPLSAQVALTSVGWGTKIDMHCSYGHENTWQNPAAEGDWSYSLWVVDNRGDASQVSTWKAESGSTVTLTAGTALALDDIRTLQVRSVTTDDVLLSRRLP